MSVWQLIPTYSSVSITCLKLTHNVFDLNHRIGSVFDMSSFQTFERSERSKFRQLFSIQKFRNEKLSACRNQISNFRQLGVKLSTGRGCMMWQHRCAGGLKKKWYLRSGPNAIDISQGSLTCPTYTDTGPPFLYGDSDTSPHLVAFYDPLGIRRTYSRLKPPSSSRGRKYFVHVWGSLRDSY